ncbi:alpha/beta fold hydrolase [Streptantibioticus parmotrematis]|uniref:alpha/beta fold hydrolase n=1 Tax=Streptantibioticus parmotrematis TaxID=2873249 RepID=UPI00340EA5D6
MADVTTERFLAAYDEVLAGWGDGVEAIDVPTPYGTTRVNALGAPDAPPLLLLPGGNGATSASWYANAPVWARTHRVLAADLVGAPGRSVPGARPVRGVDDLTGWLDALTEGLGLRSLTLGGHSYGGWIALHYALRAPRGRVERLVLIDPTQCFAGFRPGYLARAVPMLLRPTPRRVRSFLAWETRGAALDPGWLRLQEAAAGFPSARPATGPRPKAEGFRAPTLVVLAGRGRVQDPVRAARGATRALPHAEVVTLPDATHHTLPHHTPAALDEAVSRFLTGSA